jgi:hypothetical protein
MQPPRNPSSWGGPQPGNGAPEHAPQHGMQQHIAGHALHMAGMQQPGVFAAYANGYASSTGSGGSSRRAGRGC